MDYLSPPGPVDGEYRKILSVRDLATGYHLLSLPVPEESGRATADALESLFREHGAPLVLKSDNGSPLTAAEVQGVLSRWGVTHLRSPARTPSYNGSCEAGVGALKTRAHHAAARLDRPGEWTCDDVEAARAQANELGRPRGALGPTPDEAWARRGTLEDEERGRFLSEVTRQQLEVLRERGYYTPTALSEAEVVSVARVAISRALVALGILELRRRQISLPIPAYARAGIA